MIKLLIKSAPAEIFDIKFCLSSAIDAIVFSRGERKGDTRYSKKKYYIKEDLERIIKLNYTDIIQSMPNDELYNFLTPKGKYLLPETKSLLNVLCMIYGNLYHSVTESFILINGLKRETAISLAQKTRIYESINQTKSKKIFEDTLYEINIIFMWFHSLFQLVNNRNDANRLLKIKAKILSGIRLLEIEFNKHSIDDDYIFYWPYSNSPKYKVKVNYHCDRKIAYLEKWTQIKLDKCSTSFNDPDESYSECSQDIQLLIILSEYFEKDLYYSRLGRAYYFAEKIAEISCRVKTIDEKDKIQCLRNCEEQISGFLKYVKLLFGLPQDIKIEDFKKILRATEKHSWSIFKTKKDFSKSFTDAQKQLLEKL